MVIFLCLVWYAVHWSNEKSLVGPFNVDIFGQLRGPVTLAISWNFSNYTEQIEEVIEKDTNAHR